MGTHRTLAAGTSPTQTPVVPPPTMGIQVTPVRVWLSPHGRKQGTPRGGWLLVLSLGPGRAGQNQGSPRKSREAAGRGLARLTWAHLHPGAGQARETQAPD